LKYEELILNLENELLRPETRKSPEKLRGLLSEDFIEYCSSGSIYNYNIYDTFYEENVEFKIIDFNTRELSKYCILATYKVNKIYHNDNTVKSSLRSSIWKLYESKWKMIFHQGTIIK
jgi:hypothetical protein